MADIEKLIGVYKDWPEGKLLEEYDKKSDYSPDAIKAMERVLADIGLLEDIKSGGLSSLLEKERSEKKIAEKAWIQDRPIRVFNKDYLPPDHNGIFAHGLLLNKTKKRLGSKGDLKLFIHDEQVTLTLKHGEFEKTINAPFECLYYGTKTVKRTNFFKTSEWFTLRILIRVGENEWISIEEEQRSFKDIPKGWVPVDYDDIRIQTPFMFEYLSTEVKLIDLKKVFDEFQA